MFGGKSKRKTIVSGGSSGKEGTELPVGPKETSGMHSASIPPIPRDDEDIEDDYKVVADAVGAKDPVRMVGEAPKEQIKRFLADLDECLDEKCEWTMSRRRQAILAICLGISSIADARMNNHTFAALCHAWGAVIIAAHLPEFGIKCHFLPPKRLISEALKNTYQLSMCRDTEKEDLQRLIYFLFAVTKTGEYLTKAFVFNSSVIASHILQTSSEIRTLCFATRILAIHRPNLLRTKDPRLRDLLITIPNGLRASLIRKGLERTKEFEMIRYFGEYPRDQKIATTRDFRGLALDVCVAYGGATSSRLVPRPMDHLKKE